MWLSIAYAPTQCAPAVTDDQFGCPTKANTAITAHHYVSCC